MVASSHRFKSPDAGTDLFRINYKSIQQMSVFGHDATYLIVCCRRYEYLPHDRQYRCDRLQKRLDVDARKRLHSAGGKVLWRRSRSTGLLHCKCTYYDPMFQRPWAKTIKKNTNSTQNKSQTHRAKQYEVRSFLITDCELSTDTCSKNVYSIGPLCDWS